MIRPGALAQGAEQRLRFGVHVALVMDQVRKPKGQTIDQQHHTLGGIRANRARQIERRLGKAPIRSAFGFVERDTFGHLVVQCLGGRNEDVRRIGGQRQRAGRFARPGATQDQRHMGHQTASTAKRIGVACGTGSENTASKLAPVRIIRAARIGPAWQTSAVPDSTRSRTSATRAWRAAKLSPPGGATVQGSAAQGSLSARSIPAQG